MPSIPESLRGLGPAELRARRDDIDSRLLRIHQDESGKTRNLTEPGDFEEGMTAASAIGDDTLERNAGQAVNPETFTHGTSAQRMEALRAGMEGANDSVCDRYVQVG